MVTGTVEKWVLGKGFGFIKSGEESYWVHHSAIEGGNRLVEGEAVQFEIGDSGKKKAAQKNALKVTGQAVRSLQKGKLEGKVKSWKSDRGYGFIIHEAEGEVYVHFSSFGGGRLEPGKQVSFDMEDVGHKTGRKVATNVSGDGVIPRGEHHGTVTNWNWKGYGFIREDDNPDLSIFVHASALGVPGGYLAEGKEIYFDLEDSTTEGKDGKVRKIAVNVSGPAVHGEDSALQGLGRGGDTWGLQKYFAAASYGGRGGGAGMGGYSRPVSEAMRAKRKEAASEGRRVIVGNLPWSASWQVLKDHFKEAGTVEHADVFYDYTTGQSKGIGVVEFKTPAEAQAAIDNLNHSEIRGRDIWVREDRDGSK
eukprot:TRINITY_DN3379_c0_g1_i1.p1 TRINITY_DN3379_c0_g1~~TRINITY_DN3379_c0_g1_i1.p1  ORF type:complete len:379 (+),score=163.37 TRINITY_DN3379_c0_g1_i1:48-1139(+)